MLGAIAVSISPGALAATKKPIGATPVRSINGISKLSRSECKSCQGSHLGKNRVRERHLLCRTGREPKVALPVHYKMNIGCRGARFHRAVMFYAVLACFVGLVTTRALAESNCSQGVLCCSGTENC